MKLQSVKHVHPNTRKSHCFENDRISPNLSSRRNMQNKHYFLLLLFHSITF